MARLFATAPVVPPSAEPREEVDYAANEDGPWVRTPQELDAQMSRLLDEREAIRAAMAVAPSGQVNLREAYAEGVWAASNWTLARTRETPLTRVSAAVNDDGLREEIRVARVVVDAGEATVGAAYARGVLGWLGWLAGARETVAYPS